MTRENHLYETAKKHAVFDVPIAHPEDSVSSIVERLFGKRYACASHIAVTERGKFAGIITVEDLFSSEPEKKAKDIMDTDSPMVNPHTDQEVAAWQAVQREEYALAVVDHDGYFLGIIPPKTLLQILLQEHEEDLSIISGLVESKERIIKSNSTPLKDRILQRLPWLLIGLIGSFLSAGIVDIFEEEIKKHVMLAFFIPTVVYLADAIGTQTEAVVVRFVSLDLKVSDIPLKETLTTASIGFILFILSLVVISTFWKDENVAFVVSLAILLASTIAGFIASVFPIILDKLHMDPAYGSGPIATVLQDSISIVVYFTVCSLFI